MGVNKQGVSEEDNPLFYLHRSKITFALKRFSE
jgi:hypothetical protein